MVCIGSAVFMHSANSSEELFSPLVHDSYHGRLGIKGNQLLAHLVHTDGTVKHQASITGANESSAARTFATGAAPPVRQA